MPELINAVLLMFKLEMAASNVLLLKIFNLKSGIVLNVSEIDDIITKIIDKIAIILI